MRTIPAREGVSAPLPDSLHPELKTALGRHGIRSLYSHQAEAWESVRNGNNTVIVTPTASGKTLCYNLPVMQTLLEDPKARALYLFPTKALSQDQQSALNEIVFTGTEMTAPLKICTYDGDTPQTIRRDARENGRIVISNPDMLHSGILPNHPKWLKFFSGLKYIVIDEMHSYRGVFGSHIANLVRRIRRLASFYGSDPTFILCSATIGNPAELAEQIVGNPVTLIDNNGAPSGEKTVILYNPPLIDAVQGIRRSVMNEGQRWALAFLRERIKTILFAHSRIRTEVIASYINESLRNVYTENSRTRVEPYRGGLLPGERRQIEQGLRNGDIMGVVSTNALELGIDIGGLDASVITGFPGSFASFWQQAGRAGRRQTTSAAVFIASSSPLDQFIISHPEYFFERPPEEARIDPENPYILIDHIKCAAFELPFTDAEIAEGRFFGENARDALDFLEEDGILRHTAGRWHWSERSYPAEAISLRSAMIDNVVIIDITKGKHEVIGELDRPSAKEMAFPKAVYIHRGRQYMVKELNIEERRCYVEESEVNYFTDGVTKKDIKLLSEDSELFFTEDGLNENAPHADGSPENDPRENETLLFRTITGDMLIRSQVTKFKKLKFHTHENIGFGEILLPPEEMESRGTVLVFDWESKAGSFLKWAEEHETDFRRDPESRSETAQTANADNEMIASGLIIGGLGKLLQSVASLYLLCDPRDLGRDPRVRDTHFAVPALYIYDRCPGGNGLTESLPEKLPAILTACRELVSTCPCENGCPSCIGVDAAATGIKELTVEFLSIISGNI
ncbi:MAG: DEAD/DEAH box helicase [Spirochaetaceae bacterium]|nr:DEAD/DEAH box helicase [Spirochaetaceae bacterium]